MTDRDHFAAAALAGIIGRYGDLTNPRERTQMASTAYDIADAMLEKQTARAAPVASPMPEVEVSDGNIVSGF